MARVVQPFVPLESGDRLTRAEFHARYCARPDIKRAELVQGVVYVPSPTRFSFHGEQHGFVMGWLGFYVARHPEVRLAVEPTVYLSEDDEVQPDAVLFHPGREGGGVRITEDGYLEGAPDLIVEVAASSASYDLHDKLESYRRAGVREYLVWRVLDRQFDWLCLRGTAYARLQPDDRGIITSEVFPGLRLNVPAILLGDLAAVIDTLASA
jgi:Uma2 family endonuclease